MQAAVFLCLLGLALAQDSAFQKFANRFSWDQTGGETATEVQNSRDVQNSNVCLTDQAACGCCLMHQQMEKMKRNFNHSLNELQSELKSALDTLNQFRGTRSAFSVSLFTEAVQRCFGPFRDDTIITYKHIFLNMGNNYDMNTGIFTVPRAGVYSLALTVYSDAGAPGNSLAACAALQVNGLVQSGPREFNLQDQEDSATVSIVILLKKGDKVTVNLPIGCFLCDNSNHYNTFSGFLLYATD